MLPRLRLLQIGDIHLPSGASAQPFVDLKDRSFPTGLSSAISVSPLKRVFKKIFSLLEEEQIHCVLFMGDFTDYGQIRGYEACCRYIAQALQLGSGRKFEHIPIGIVPGNHDVDRTLAKRPGTATKFSPLSAALGQFGLGNLPVTGPVRIEVGADGPKTRVLLMNSCWGCGDESSIPEEFRRPIVAAIDQALGSSGGSKALKAYYDRQLDTPALTEDSISALMHEIGSTPGREIPIIVAHHNLLPQRLPRLAPYTELINGGALRASLCEAGRPIIYLHGHIHEDPIELVQNQNGAPILVISAPNALRGFNVVDIIFTPGNVAIACHITPIRFDQSGFLTQLKKVSMPLAGRRRRLDPLSTSLFTKLLHLRVAYWSEVESIASKIKPKPDETRLKIVVEQLVADGLLTIENDNLPQDDWIIRADM
ncbi:metallophosphoesterase family protein [Salinarimonas sp. NSM]|uniref:metallophosphoesterase family protein n=1 Tax=Salinarimonas sp. NSM TaxID=3458003 RepID=UPI00403544B1